MQQQIRLNKYIASTGLTSRRGADELIINGRVKVNGKVVVEPGVSVTEKDSVLVDNKKINVQNKKYVIFYKPAGYITTTNDPQERKTIYSLLPEDFKYLKPAGRLDKDSSGLILLTNDGDLIQKLTHPKEHVSKIYRVMVEGKITQQDLLKLKNGIEIEENKIAYAECDVIEIDKAYTVLRVVLYQGYNRQIRKMMDIIKHPVISLKRLSQANLNVAGLEKGSYRYLKPKEVRELFNFLKNVAKKNNRKQ